MTTTILPPFPIFSDIDGEPLEAGYIWIGVENLPPQTNPTTVYWDEAFTQPAAQPIRTSGGYPVNNGTPAALYAPGAYSILVQDSRGTLVYSALSETLLVSSANVTFLQAGASAVTRTAQSKMRDVVSVRDFGAVGDGAFTAGGSPSGTDNLAAFNAALAAAVSTGASRVHVPGGRYYLSGKLTVPGGVILEGDGTAWLPGFLNNIGKGTALLINGSTSDDCLVFAENSAHAGLRDISIYNTNTNAIRSVVSIVGHLYPRMTNVEISSLKRTTGVGLFLVPSQTGAQYETLWGAFHNVMVTITDVGAANEASVRYGLSIYGLSSTKVCNANSFVSGQFAGAWAGLLIDGTTATSGALSCVFHGVKFDTNYDGTYTPEFRAAANGVFGWLEDDCYIYPVVHIKRGRDIAFHGCYFEAAGSPATYNDGVNGTHTLIAAFMNDGGTTANKGTDVIGCNWNGCYLYDISQGARVDPSGIGVRYSTRTVENVLAIAGAVQSIPARQGFQLRPARVASILDRGRNAPRSATLWPA